MVVASNAVQKKGSADRANIVNGGKLRVTGATRGGPEAGRYAFMTRLLILVLLALLTA